jgi:hypothetical protein
MLHFNTDIRIVLTNWKKEAQIQGALGGDPRHLDFDFGCVTLHESFLPPGPRFLTTNEKFGPDDSQEHFLFIFQDFKNWG